MPKKQKPPKKNALGRPLIKQKNRHLGHNPTRSDIYSSRDQEKADVNKLESITQQTDLQEFMAKVAANEQNYITRRCDIKLVTQLEAAGVLTDEQELEVSKAQRNHSSQLRIPRRPKWDANTTAEELHKAETEEFEHWRQDLGSLAEINNITVTPYEKNIHVWQQLWRVVERSDVVVQIVDARNPLLFRCTDLETYVKEIDEAKVNVVLVNKSDFLTAEQRELWTEYFVKEGIFAVFFSALEASKDIGGLTQLPEEEEGIDEGFDNKLEDELESLNVDDNTQLSNILVDTCSNSKLYSESTVNESFNDDSNTDEEGSTASVDYESASDTPCMGTTSPQLQTTTTPQPSTTQQPRTTPQPSTTQLTTSRVTCSKLYNREELIELLTSLCPAPRLLQTHSIIGLVGYPNVGKSSTINCLMNEKRVTVSATPGKTKHFQTLYLTPELVLCDCPGLVFPGFVSTKQEMIIWGILSIDRIKRDYESSILLLCHKLSRQQLVAAYSIPLPGKDTRPPTPEEFLSSFALTRSFMSARGRPDVSRAARVVLKDFMNGRLLYSVAPPHCQQQTYYSYTVQPKCKTLVKLTPHQERFMPETEDDVQAKLLAMMGIVEEEDKTPHKGSKPRKERVKKIKGAVEYRERPDGTFEELILKPWKNKSVTTKGKRNPNNNNPYENLY